MANPCGPVDDGAAWAKNIYSAHHNPALYFTQLQGGTVDEAITPAAPCRTFDLPMGTTGPNDTTAFDQAVSTGNVGNLNVVVPNDCANGHDPCGTRDRVRQFDDSLVRPGSADGRRWPGVTRPVSQHCEARPAGFEPATSRSGGGRSIH